MRPPFLSALNYTEDDFRRASENNHFLELRMPIVFKCNLKCNYCNQNAPFQDENKNITLQKSVSAEPPLTDEERIQLVEKAAGMGARTVVLSGAGETALSDELINIIDAIRTNGMNCLIVSNLLPIDEKLGERLLSKEVNIMGKLNSLDPHIQEELVGLRGAYEQFFKKIKMLIKIGFTDQHRFSLNSVICKENIKEIIPLFVFCREHGVIPWIEKMTFEGRAEEENDISLQETLNLFEKIARLDKSVYGYEWNASPPLVACPTYERYKYLFTIDMFGNAFPTNASQTLKAGNIRSQSPLTIYRSEKFKTAWKMDKHLKNHI
jgi:MoaA/NifB/PqqE/SkfB family radical SAM enzyme